MAGTVLENLSGRKLAILVSCVLVIQVVCFLIGGCVAPAPSNVDPMLGYKCLTKKPLQVGEFDEINHIPRGDHGRKNINCIPIDVDLDDPDILKNPNITPNHLVFAFQAPLPKDGYVLDYSRWMQNLIGVLQMDIAFNHRNPVGTDPEITFDVKLSYRNKWDPDDKWTLIANSTETRHLDCVIDDDKKVNGYHYDCKLLPLFELGSLHHDYYLLNLRLPTDMTGKSSVNSNIGHVDDIWLVVIHQNGGFTKVWVALKTFFFPLVLGTIVWYWHRITKLSRSPILIEKMLFALGIALSTLNMPLEYVTLVVELPFMLLLSDIRQGFFYASLLSFWLIFCGEHLVDDVERNRLRSYWKYLTSVVICCFCLFLFDMCERGVQLKNPFFSIWASKSGAQLAVRNIDVWRPIFFTYRWYFVDVDIDVLLWMLIFSTVSLTICKYARNNFSASHHRLCCLHTGFVLRIAAGLYFLFLCYLIFKVFQNIGFKRNTLPNMSSARRMYYEGIIYRFKFLMAATVICAALTVISYILGEVSEGRWKWDDSIKLDYTSAFFTGVYGMWNLYVFILLVLYAPSHKRYGNQNASDSSNQEEIEFSRLTTSEPSPSEPTEISSLTGIAKKAAFD